MLVDDEELPVIPAFKDLRGPSKWDFNLNALSVWQDADNREVKRVAGYCHIAPKELHCHCSNFSSD
jgi:hypothetical protein